MPEVCRFFLQGACRYGTHCRFAHETPDQEEAILRANEIEASREAECGICCDVVAGKFGLLNCNCIFCLKCIKEWRQKGKEISDKATVRLCPLCRTESLDVVPSDYLVTNPGRKQRLIASYASVRGQIPCKHFNHNLPASCPFGNACAYAHLLPDGTPAPPMSPPTSTRSRRRRHEILDLPEPSTASPQELRAYLEHIVQEVLLESGSTHEVTQHLIRAVIIDAFEYKYGEELTLEILSF